MNIEELESKTKTELLTLAKEKGIAKAETLNKPDLVLQLLQSDVEQDGHVFCRGVLDVMSDGYGFPQTGHAAAQPCRCLCFPIADPPFWLA